jgi:hypothetical protein
VARVHGLRSFMRALTWANVNFDDPNELELFYAQERRKSGDRAEEAFRRLRRLRILNDCGDLLLDGFRSRFRRQRRQLE